MAREQELKLAVAQASWPVITAWLEEGGAQRLPMRALRNTYFDTPDGQLNRQRIALRIRQHGEDYIQTLKTKGTATRGLHDRQEWDWPLEEFRLDTAALKESPIKTIVERDFLQSVFSTDFERSAWLWQEGDRVIEYALDKGEVRSGNARAAISEVELELKGGDAAALTEQATALSRICPVFLSPVSKAEQGYFIAGLHQPVPVALAGVEDPERNLDAWLAALGYFALTGRGEFLQQAGVALERLWEGCRLGAELLPEHRSAPDQQLAPEQWSLLLQTHSELRPGTPDEVLSQLLDNPIMGQCQLALVSQ
jgi:triphosphatase